MVIWMTAAEGVVTKPTCAQKSIGADTHRPHYDCSQIGVVPIPAYYRLAVGVMSGSSSADSQRRGELRKTWLRWQHSEPVLVCFVVGGGVVLHPEVENDRSLDVVRLNMTEKGMSTLSAKIYRWFSLCSLHLFPLTYVAKTDDDSFLHLPRISKALMQLDCYPQVYFGRFAIASYHPRNARLGLCGYSQLKRGFSNWHKYGCSSHGFSDPFVFGLGLFYALSGTLTLRLAQCKDALKVAMRRNEHRTGVEDLVMGYNIARLNQTSSISYVHNDFMSNLGCAKTSAYDAPPTNRTLVLHDLKRGRGQHYLWKVFGKAKTHPHDPKKCNRVTGKP